MRRRPCELRTVTDLIDALCFKRKNGTASVNTDSQWSKQEACFARAIQVWLAVIATPESLVTDVVYSFVLFLTVSLIVDEHAI